MRYTLFFLSFSLSLNLILSFTHLLNYLQLNTIKLYHYYKLLNINNLSYTHLIATILISYISYLTYNKSTVKIILRDKRKEIYKEKKKRLIYKLGLYHLIVYLAPCMARLWLSVCLVVCFPCVAVCVLVVRCGCRSLLVLYNLIAS